MTDKLSPTVERYENLIFSVPGVDDPDGEWFMRGFAYGRFTSLNSELARHWGVSRGRMAGECPIIEETSNLLTSLSASGDVVERLRRGKETWSLNPAFVEVIDDAIAALTASGNSAETVPYSDDHLGIDKPSGNSGAVSDDLIERVARAIDAQAQMYDVLIDGEEYAFAKAAIAEILGDDALLNEGERS